MYFASPVFKVRILLSVPFTLRHFANISPSLLCQLSPLVLGCLKDQGKQGNCPICRLPPNSNKQNPQEIKKSILPSATTSFWAPSLPYILILRDSTLTLHLQKESNTERNPSRLSALKKAPMIVLLRVLRAACRNRHHRQLFTKSRKTAGSQRTFQGCARENLF